MKFPKQAFIPAALIVVLTHALSSFAGPGKIHTLFPATGKESLPPIAIHGPGARQLFEAALDDKEEFLRHYKPEGGTLLAARVEPAIQPGTFPFMLKLKSHFMGLTSTLAGTLTQKSYPCPAQPKGHGIQLDYDLAQSDELMSDNVRSFQINICLQENPADGSAILRVSSTLIEGADSNFLMFKFVRDEIKNQVRPMTVALQEMIALKRGY